MANTRELVERNKAIKNIRKITRTMELIATAQFRKALDRAVQAEAFTRKITELAADLSATVANASHPLLVKREPVKNSVLLVLCSNRGLCGGYNTAILREAMKRIQEIRAEGSTLHLELSGKRAITYFKFQGIPSEKQFIQFEDKPRFDEVDELATRYLAEYIDGKIDRVEVAYMKFITVARQSAVVEQLLPLASVSDTKTPTTPVKQVEYEFLPSAQDILEELLPASFKARLFKCFLDSAVSEQIARRITMKAATENADEMIKLLTSQYNRARQAAITKEIAEVIGGVEALK